MYQRQTCKKHNKCLFWWIAGLILEEEQQQIKHCKKYVIYIGMEKWIKPMKTGITSKERT